MKSNQNENGKRLARKLLLVSGVIALAMTAGTAREFARVLRQTEKSEQDVAVLDRLLEARRLNVLIHQLNSGHTAEAHRFLNTAFAADLRVAEKLGATANPSAAGEVKCALAQFAKDEKVHPDYYAVAQVKTTPSNLQLARRQAGQ